MQQQDLQPGIYIHAFLLSIARGFHQKNAIAILNTLRIVLPMSEAVEEPDPDPPFPAMPLSAAVLSQVVQS